MIISVTRELMSCHYGKVMEGWDEAREGTYNLGVQGVVEEKWCPFVPKAAGTIQAAKGSCLWEGALESAAIRGVMG